MAFKKSSLLLWMVMAALFLAGTSVRANTTKRLFFVSDRDGNHEIYSSDASGGDARNLSQNPGDDRDPALSPDGNRLAWTRNGNLWLMNPDGTNQQQLTTTGTDSAPSWTPNGTQIIFSSRRGGKNQVFAIQPDAGPATQLVTSDANDENPFIADLPRTSLQALPQATPVPAAPQVMSLSPDSAEDAVGVTRTWTVTVRDDNGVGDLASVWFMTGRTADWDAGITLLYLVKTRQLFVRNKGTWSTPISAGSGTLETERMFLDGASVTASPASDGKTLTLSFALRVKDPMSGTNSLWTRVEDAGGMIDPKSAPFGFVPHGIWKIGVNGVDESPLAVVTPGARGQVGRLAQGVETEVLLDVTDGDGAGNIESAWLQVGSVLDWGVGMTVSLDAATKRLYLRSTGGAQWLGGDIIGQSAGTLENDAVSIRLDGCFLSPVPNGLRLHLCVTPKAAFVGTQKVWTRVTDHENHIASDADYAFGFSSGGQWQIAPASATAGWGTTFRPFADSWFPTPVAYTAWNINQGRLNPVFDWKGGLPIQAGAGSDAVKRRIGFNQDPNILAMEFQTDAPQWELLCATGGGSWRVMVRDAKSTTWKVLGSWKLPDAATPSVQVFRQAEGIRVARRWRVENSNQLALGVRLKSGDLISAAPAVPALKRVVWCGDSFVEGVGSPATWQGFAAQAGALLNLDSHFDASGGTGYIASGPPGWGRSPFGQRISNITQSNPAVVVVFGSTNDVDKAPTDVGTAASSFYAALRRALPNAKIVVIGPVRPSSAWNVGPLNQTLQSAATQNGAIFINASTWITGTGNVANGRGDGNADAYISADGVHPSPAGHAYFAQKAAAALRPILSAP